MCAVFPRRIIILIIINYIYIYIIIKRVMKRFHIRSREIHRESENGSLKSLKPFSFFVAKLNNTKNVQLPTYPASYKESYLTSALNKLQYHSSSFTYILVTNTYELSIQSYRNIVIIRDIYIYKIVSYRIQSRSKMCYVLRQASSAF